MGIHSRARPTIASLLVSYGNGYEKQKILWQLDAVLFIVCMHNCIKLSISDSRLPCLLHSTNKFYFVADEVKLNFPTIVTVVMLLQDKIFLLHFLQLSCYLQSSTYDRFRFPNDFLFYLHLICLRLNCCK